MRVPHATYRLQLGPGLTFDDAAGLADYLHDLGIGDCYTSPFFETSRAGSHGYDVSDPNRFREELGAEAGFRRLAAALASHGLGLLVDVVPNHMGIAGNANRRWHDVLEWGPVSPYAAWFDIDWTPVQAELAHKVLLPILGDQYGTVLESGQLELVLEAGRFAVRCHDTLLPLAPRSWSRVLSHGIERLQRALGPDDPHLVELKSLIAWFATLAPLPDADAERVAALRGHAEKGRERLVALLAASAAIRTFVQDTVRVFNGAAGEPRSFDLLDALLGDQAYRLAYWRVAGEEINYRRFFDINDLAAIRMERPDVFAEAHDLVFRLVREGVVTGLRIDHPDGLYAPAEYFQRLQQACGGRFYIVAEKILAPGETLPETWATEGTTGYEFLNLLNGIFVDRTQARAMDQIYTRLLHARPSFAEIVYAGKRLTMETSMASELNVLGHRLAVISERDRAARDFTLRGLTNALREIVAVFPVYRTYVGEAAAGPSDADREYIARAIAQAKRRTPSADLSIFDWIHDVLVLRFPPWTDETERRERTDFVMRFQQITGPVMAKGYEDTALYRHHRLASLNEVGGDPGRFGASLAEFHAEMTARASRWPHALSATATHDTKRGEDVRARIDVLSEIPVEWQRRVSTWQRLNRKHRTTVDGEPVPGPNEEYLIYQTLVGAWPIGVDRLRDYVLKAAREAKAHTSWINADVRYEEALVHFVERILDPTRAGAFLDDFLAFQPRVAHFGAFTSLAQVVIKTTAPGVPDFYQGTELWDLSLVDPDNRRPVDWPLRRRMLADLRAVIAAAPERTALAHELVKTKDDGRVKLYCMVEALAFRRAHGELFAGGAYEALEAQGPLGEHVCAFARVLGGDAAITVAPRLLARRGLDDTPVGREYWQATWLGLPAGLGRRFVNVFTGERLTAVPGAEREGLALGDVFASFPVALLATETT